MSSGRRRMKSAGGITPTTTATTARATQPARQSPAIEITTVANTGSVAIPARSAIVTMPITIGRRCTNQFDTATMPTL